MGGRLPKRLRQRTAVTAAFEAAMNSGAPIVDNAGPLYVVGQMEADWETCPECDGDCMTTVTRERPGYLDEDVDVDCFTCDGSGRVQS